MRKWNKLSSVESFATPFFSVTSNRFSDSCGFEDDFYRLNFKDWVHVIPELSSGELIVIKLFRFGIEEYSLEFPAGQIEIGKSPEEAARDELLEETGYTAAQMEPLGWVYPNPATQNNKAFFYRASGLELVGPQMLEDAEDISVLKISRNELSEEIKKGVVVHGLALLAYYRFINSSLEV